MEEVNVLRARYKSSRIISGIRRAHEICSTSELFNQEIKKFKQILVNNGYTNTEFDYELDNFYVRKIKDNYL